MKGLVENLTMRETDCMEVAECLNMQLPVAQLPAIHASLPATELRRFSRSCEWALSATGSTKPAVTWDLFDVQLSAVTCWKSDALRNMCALSEFR